MNVEIILSLSDVRDFAWEFHILVVKLCGELRVLEDSVVKSRELDLVSDCHNLALNSVAINVEEWLVSSNAKISRNAP